MTLSLLDISDDISKTAVQYVVSPWYWYAASMKIELGTNETLYILIIRREKWCPCIVSDRVDKQVQWINWHCTLQQQHEWASVKIKVNWTTQFHLQKKLDLLANYRREGGILSINKRCPSTHLMVDALRFTMMMLMGDGHPESWWQRTSVITGSRVMLFERWLKVKRSDSVGYWWRFGCGKWAIIPWLRRWFCVVDLSFGTRIWAGKCRETPNSTVFHHPFKWESRTKWTAGILAGDPHPLAPVIT
jgi:hypothetical protein